MPFRSIATLQSWVREFEQLNPEAPAAIRVIPQDGDEGADTGLVAMRVLNSPTEVYFEPPDPTQSEWTIVFEPREQPVQLTSSQVLVMAEGVSAVSRPV